jgi:AraC-like DNA-binding protein
MLESTSDMHVDFVARWELPGPTHYRYRVPCLQLLLVEQGRMWAKVDGRRLWAEPGGMFCLGRQALNEYGWDAPVQYWEAHLTFRSPFLIEGRPPPPQLDLGLHLADVRAALSIWSQELSNPGDLALFRVRAAAWNLLAGITAAAGRAPARAHLDDWDEVRMRLETGLGRPLELSSLARACGLSPDYLIRGFRRRFGLSPMAWRKRATLRRAVDLIACGEQVKAVAARLGFTDASAFTRAFRRQFGQSPTTFIRHGPPLGAGEGAAAGYQLNRHVRPPGVHGWFSWG